MEKEINIQEFLKVTETVSVKMRTYMSIQHIQSAALFARHSAKIETEFVSSDNQTEDRINGFCEHRGFVIGAIFSGVSFLESLINEIYTDISDNCTNHIESLDKDIKRIASKLWKMGIPRSSRYRIVDKYELFLHLLNKEFVKDQGAYPDVLALIELRNHLVHSEPEWISSGQKRSGPQKDLHKFEKSLRGKKFDLNPLTGENNPFYPDQCLSYGCAKWAVNSSIYFADKFFEIIGTEPVYDHVRNNLKTELS